MNRMGGILGYNDLYRFNHGRKCLSAMTAYVQAMRKYADFDGRAKRSEYWWFAIIHTIINTVLNLSISYTLVAMSSPRFIDFFALIAIPVVYGLATIVPTVAVNIRRLHDTGRSGLWLLLIFAPFGIFALIVFMLIRSDVGENKYGAQPL